MSEQECPFCAIVDGKAPARKLRQSKSSLAILDIGQIMAETGEFSPGRSLVVPKRHVSRFYDLEDEELADLFILAKKVSAKLKEVFEPEFVTVLIRGQRIPHTHVILQPTFKDDPISRLFDGMSDAFRQAPSELLDDMVRRIGW